MKTSLMVTMFASVIAASLLAGCGNKSEDSNEVSKNESRSAVAGLPEGAVIAVPVDTTGQELNNQADLRLIPTSPNELQGEAISNAFNNGRRPDRVLDEMDSLSSTESFQGWGNYRQIGQPGLGYGFNQYQPVYYHGGNPFFWRFFNMHRCGNMNYYYYRRSQQPQPWGSNWNTNWNTNVPGQYGPGIGGYYGNVQPIGYY